MHKVVLDGISDYVWATGDDTGLNHGGETDHSEVAESAKTEKCAH